MIGYWFSREDGTTKYQTVPAEVGRTDRVKGEIIPCRNGLHSSPSPFYALNYASGPVLWEVEIGDDAVPHGAPVDKHASATRKYIRRADVTKTLRRFAATQALGVIQLWDAPRVVEEYLSDESQGIDRADIRDAAKAAALDAAKAAAQAAARGAAWAATWGAAWGAAQAAARGAALNAAQAAAWDDAWDAAWDAAKAAAQAAAQAAARGDVWGDAWDAAWDATHAAARTMFDDMCQKELEKMDHQTQNSGGLNEA